MPLIVCMSTSGILGWYITNSYLVYQLSQVTALRKTELNDGLRSRLLQLFLCTVIAEEFGGGVAVSFGEVCEMIHLKEA